MSIPALSVARGAVVIGGNSGYYSATYVGQSFSWQGTDGEALGGFRFLDADGANPVPGAGQLYLFDQEYTGTPEDLPSSFSLAIGEYDADFEGWIFSGNVALNANDTYYVYASELILGFGFGYEYPEGSLFFSYDVDDPFNEGLGGASANFELVVVPEPSAAMLVLGGLAISLSRRRR